MGLLSLLFGSKKKKTDEHSTSYVSRAGHLVATDEAFDAWTSGDLEGMLEAAEQETNVIDRHFLLMGIVDATYKMRQDKRSREICREYSEIHINEFSKISKPLKKEMDGFMPRVPTFQKYATLLTELGEYNKAIEVCKKAISFRLHDGTKSGFEGRIERIRKKSSKSKP